MRASVLAVAVAAGVLGLSAGAHAAKTEASTSTPLEGYRFEVTGGIGGYTGGLGQLLLNGGVWHIEAARKVLPFVSAGLAYDGSANRVVSPLDPAPPIYVRHGATGLVRASMPLWKFEPYVETGIGAAHAGLRGVVPPTLLLGWSPQVPVAAGLQLHSGIVTAGVRAGYTWMLMQHDAPGGGLFNTGLTLGASF